MAFQQQIKKLLNNHKLSINHISKKLPLVKASSKNHHLEIFLVRNFITVQAKSLCPFLQALLKNNLQFQ